MEKRLVSVLDSRKLSRAAFLLFDHKTATKPPEIPQTLHFDAEKNTFKKESKKYTRNSDQNLDRAR